MNDFIKDYMDKLLGISAALENHSLSFKDLNLERNYRKFDLNKQIYKSKFFSLMIIFGYILAFIYSILKYKQLIWNNYTLLGMLLTEIILTAVGHHFSSNYKVFNYLIYIRFFLFYITAIILFHFEHDGDLLTRYKFYRGFFNYLNFLYLYMIEFSYLMLIGVPVLNSISIILLKFDDFFGDTPIYYDLIGMFIYYFATFFIKKDDYYNKKIVFYDNFRKNNYIDYIVNLIDGLNNMVISTSKNEVIFINNFTNEYLEKKGYYKNSDFMSEEGKGNETNNDLKVENILNKRMNYATKLFFQSLILNISPFYSLKSGTNLSRILNDIMSINLLDSNNFYKLGNFSSNVENTINYFEVYTRKLKFKDEILEILIYDITEVKQAEKVNIESKLKGKILSKIAHEFKTPMITIISLINRLLNINSEVNLYNNVNLLHVNNLSYYVLNLIGDMINYVSNCIDMRLDVTYVNLKEVIIYCFNILNTLVECNESKQGKIQTKLDIEDSLLNVKLRTDEYRLKQIILNYITNAYRFTHAGYIKIKAKLIKDSDIIQVCIKDTGLGIKDDDKKHIFKENYEFNLDQEYNSKGSVIGLSIIKNLANSMNLTVGFKSTYGKGSKFFVNFPNHSIIHYSKKSINLDSISRIEQDIDRSEDILLPQKTIKEDELSTIRVNYELIKYDEIKHCFEQSLYLESDHYQVQQSISFTLGIRNSDKDIIVVVDDHKLIRENTINLFKTVLHNYNSDKYDIIEGSDGIDLLRLVMNDKEGKIKYIFCDENMEYLNGSETVKIIRNLENNKKLVKYNIISVTAFDDDQTQKRILDSGFDSVIHKPCTKSIITEILFKN